MSERACPECSSRDVYRTKKSIATGGGYAPDWLPGLGSFFKSAQMRVYVCRACGLTRWFAEPESRERIPHSNKWERT